MSFWSDYLCKCACVLCPDNELSTGRLIRVQGLDYGFKVWIQNGSYQAVRKQTKRSIHMRHTLHMSAYVCRPNSRETEHCNTVNMRTGQLYVIPVMTL